MAFQINQNVTVDSLAAEKFAEPFKTHKNDHEAKHPVEIIQDNILQNEERMKMRRYADLYGSHLPSKLILERNIIASFQGVPGVRPNSHGLDLVMGRYDTFDFSDYLGYDNPRHNVDLHELAEKKLGF